MVAETNLEREFKFDVAAEFDPPDLRPLVGRTERLAAQRLTTTYLDTPDRRLWARGITLRHRSEAEGDAPARGPGKWTLKLPLPAGLDDTGGTARSELSWRGALDAIPVEAASVLAGVTRRARMETVAVLSTERRRLLLCEGDRPWAELDDDLVTVTSGPRRGLRFRQVELELLGADATAPVAAGAVEGVLAAMRRAGATPGGSSKFALAAGLDGEPAEPDGGPPDVPGFVAGRLRSGLGLLLESDYRLRVPAAGDTVGLDARALDQAAGAVGAIRADLRLLGAVLDPVWVRHVRSDTGWLAGLLDRPRQEDALVDLVREGLRGSAPGVDASAAEELVALLRSDRHLGAKELVEALGSDRYTALLDRLQAAAEQPPLFDVAGHDPVGVPVGQVLRSALTACSRVFELELDGLGPDPGDEALDHLRVHARRLRHAAEAAGPYLGRKAGRAALAGAGVVSLLDELRRADVSARTLRELASHPSVTPTTAFAAGLVAGGCEARVERLREEWREPAARLARAGRAATAASSPGAGRHSPGGVSSRDG